MGSPESGLVVGSTQPMTRRQFLRAAGAAAVVGAISQAVPWAGLGKGSGALDTAHTIHGTQRPDVFFPQSVASGDPTPSGAILWTRLAPEHINPDGKVAVEIATDAEFTDVVRRATYPAAHLRAENAHTLRIDTDGELLPNRHYHYRFIHEGQASRTGRMRTLPEKTADIERLRLAVLTCQNFRNGYFSALGHVARDDVDYVLHLGDFIYEYNGASSDDGKAYEDRGLQLPSGAPRMESREDLDYVWARNRSDPHLQAMMERHTIIATWDDHEVTNDRSFDYEAGHHVGDSSFHLNERPDAMQEFFRDGAQAYFDWLPLRIAINRDAEDPLEVITLYRDFQFGKLVHLWMLDERWYRSPPPGEALSLGPESVGATSESRIQPGATMLGEKQKEWLAASIGGATTRWKVLGQQVQTSPLAATLPGTSVFINLDAWDGYEADRQWLTEVLGSTENAVVLTGDLHSYLVGYVKRDYNSQGAEPDGNRVAVEFMTPAVTSGGLGEIIQSQSGKPLMPGDDELFENFVLGANPHLVHFNSTRHGYAVVEFTKRHVRYHGYVVDKTQSGVPGNRMLMSVWECPVGQVALRELQYHSPSGIAAFESTRKPSQQDPRREGASEGVTEVRSVAELRAALASGADKPSPSIVSQ